MGIALAVLSVLVLIQGFVIFALLNRLLIQAKIKPMAVADMVVKDSPDIQEQPAIPRRRKLFSVEIPS